MQQHPMVLEHGRHQPQADPVNGFNLFEIDSNKQIADMYVEFNNMGCGIGTGFTVAEPQWHQAASGISDGCTLKSVQQFLLRETYGRL